MNMPNETPPEPAAEKPVRYPPPLSTANVSLGTNGKYEPTMKAPYAECGQRARFQGILVECVRRKGHPVDLYYAHSNGYVQWAFDEE